MTARPSVLRFVYAIRLKVTYGDETSGRATFRMSWGAGAQDRRAGEQVSDCGDGVNLSVETIPQDGWARLLRSGRQKTLTIWVNSMIDRFRICPDTKPFSFSPSEITLLVP